MFTPWPSVFSTSSELADVAVMLPLCAAAAAAVVVSRRTGSGCRVGAVGVLRVASLLLAAERRMNVVR